MKRSISFIASLILLDSVIVAPAAEAPRTEPPPDSNFQLYLLIGQSNMAGRGALDAESQQTCPRVEMLTKDLAWKPATDPLHFDKPAAAGVGPGLEFGKKMAEANPTVRIGLIPCAVGGTSIKVWVPGAEDKDTKTHPYDDMLQRVREAQRAGVLKGILWHQGESDRNDSDAYGRELTDLITLLRKYLKAPNLPFIAGELPGFNTNNAAATKKFNAVVQGLAMKEKYYVCVSAEGLHHKGDHLHCDAESARILGRRYAEIMIALQKQHPDGVAAAFTQ